MKKKTMKLVMQVNQVWNTKLKMQKMLNKEWFKNGKLHKYKKNLDMNKFTTLGKNFNVEIIIKNHLMVMIMLLILMNIYLKEIVI